MWGTHDHCTSTGGDGTVHRPQHRSPARERRGQRRDPPRHLLTCTAAGSWACGRVRVRQDRRLACLGHYRTGLVHTAGDIELHPRDGGTITLSQLSTEEIQQLRGHRVAYIPQDPALSLNPAIRVGDQIREVLDVHGYGSSSKERAARVAEVLEDVGLPSTQEYQRRWPHQLSGGQQQRIGIAMAFAMFPDVLILDEPTTGLDVSTQAHVLDTIRDMTKKHDVASLYITHDLAVVAELADRWRSSARRRRGGGPPPGPGPAPARVHPPAPGRRPDLPGRT